MYLRSDSTLIVFAAGFLLAVCSLSSMAQQIASGAGTATFVSIAPVANSPTAIPDAPTPQVELAAAVDPQAGQALNTQQPSADSGQPQNPAASSSSSQQPAPAPGLAAPDPGGAFKNGATQSSSQNSAQETQHEKAAEQIKEQEHQRVVGIVPMFNTTYHWDAVSLTARQKMGLALHAAVDPFQFGAAFLVAGYHEALDDDTGFGWGVEGLGKRAGAAYLDAFDGAIIGNGILPIAFRQDPRYFRMGHGSAGHRILYSLATNVIARHDNTGKWEPNYSNVGGNIIAGAISNLYYPSSNTGFGHTISTGFIVTAEGGIGSLFQEFWPDISRRVLHKDPTHGLDAQAASQDYGKSSAPK
jgi:hypothetical protein